jgi:hypothetical protein
MLDTSVAKRIGVSVRRRRNAGDQPVILICAAADAPLRVVTPSTIDPWASG